MKKRYLPLLLILLLSFSSCSVEEKINVLSSPVGIEAYNSKGFVVIGIDAINKVSSECNIKKDDVGEYLFKEGNITKVKGEDFLSREELYNKLYSIVGEDGKPFVLYKEKKLLEKSNFLSSLDAIIPSYDKTLFSISVKKRGKIPFFSETSYNKGDDYTLFLKSWLNAIFK